MAHTTYFSDRNGFLTIVGRLAGLRGGDPERVSSTMTRQAPEHWTQVSRDLRRLRRWFWAGGAVLAVLYLAGIGWAAGTFLPLALLPLYFFPGLTVGVLAFVQRFVYGKATKRTRGDSIGNLPWSDLDSFAYRLRHLFRPERSVEEETAAVFGPGPNWFARTAMWIASFVPLAIGMLLPLFAAYAYAAGRWPPFESLLEEYWGALPVMIALFILHLMAFAVSEFLEYWKVLVEEATR